MSPEKKEVFVRFASRPSRSARPDHERPSPPTSNPMFGHAPQHMQYDHDPMEYVVKVGNHKKFILRNNISPHNPN